MIPENENNEDAITVEHLLLKEKMAKCVLILLLSLLIGTLSAFFPFRLLLFLFAVLLIAAFISWGNDNKFVYALAIMIVFQNFIAIIFSGMGQSFFVTVVISLKELFVYGCIVFFFLFRNGAELKTFRLVNWAAYAYIFLIIAYFLFLNGIPLFTKSVSGRQLITPAALYLFGFYVKSKQERIMPYYLRIAAVVVIFGLIETFLLGDQFWIKLGIQRYMDDKGMTLWAFGNNGLPGNFYSFDFSGFIGTDLRRMVSFIADPTLLGQFLVLPVLYSVLAKDRFKNKRKRLMYSLLLSTGMLLTLSKGALISTAIGVLVYLLLKKNRFSQLIGMAMGYIVIFFLVIILANYQKFSSLPAHLNGLTSNLLTVVKFPFGLGLGKSGNFASLYNTSGSADTTSAGESFIGAMLGQIGIVGTLLFFVFIAAVLSALVKRYCLSQNSDFLILASALAGTVAASFLSESAISFISAGLIFTISGIYLSNESHDQGSET